jgi:hypothetical protein
MGEKSCSGNPTHEEEGGEESPDPARDYKEGRAHHCPMVDKETQVALMDRVEELFNLNEADQLREIERKLTEFGFVQEGADPATLAMVHAALELFIEIGIDEDGRVHGYELLPFEEMAKKQERFRW